MSAFEVMNKLSINGLWQCYELRHCTDDMTNTAVFMKMYFLCLLYLQALQHIILPAFVERYFLTTHIASGPNALKNERT